MTWLGVPVLDWLILAVALGLGVEAWLTTRPTPEEREAARRDAATPPRAAGPVGESPSDCDQAGGCEDADHPRN